MGRIVFVQRAEHIINGMQSRSHDSLLLALRLGQQEKIVDIDVHCCNWGPLAYRRITGGGTDSRGHSVSDLKIGGKRGCHCLQPMRLQQLRMVSLQLLVGKVTGSFSQRREVRW